MIASSIPPTTRNPVVKKEIYYSNIYRLNLFILLFRLELYNSTGFDSPNVL